MELSELKSMWQSQDRKLSEHIQLNRAILRQMLIRNPQKRMNREKITALLNILLPLIVVSFILIPNIEPRNTFNFYVGITAFGVPFLLTYAWAVKYFLIINKIDFTNPITTIKKHIKQLEKQKTKITKIGFLLMPLAITGIFIMGEIEFFTLHSLLPVGLIIVIMIISAFYSFKIALHERFKKLNKEIEEIENLEKN